LEFKRDFDFYGSGRAPPPVQIAALLAWRARPCNATKAFDDALSQATAKNRFREPRDEISGVDLTGFCTPRIARPEFRKMAGESILTAEAIHIAVCGYGRCGRELKPAMTAAGQPRCVTAR
jgi:hypothetical protein